MSATLPANEASRLNVLRQYEILDTEPESALDDLTRLAAQICGTPIALVSLVDMDRQWFKSRVGVDVDETPRELAFCAHALSSNEILVVPNPLEDERFADNPLVTGDTHIRFYAGMPLTTPSGHALGTLCVVDRIPRDLTAEQYEALRVLGRQVMMRIELRHQTRTLAQAVEAEGLASRELAQATALLEATINTVADAILVVGTSGDIIHRNRAFTELWQVPEDIQKTPNDSELLAWVTNQVANPAAFIAKVQALYANPTASSNDIVELLDGRVIERYSRPHRLGDAIVGRVWVFSDITARVQAEAEQVRLREEVIQAQAAALAELSTPLIPLSDKVVVMPLIGGVDSRRAQAVLEALLTGVMNHKAEVAILDITGVPVVDTQVANALLRAAQAVKLLGAKVVLTGIRPEIAQTLVNLGVDLSSIVTRGTLQSGISYALGR